MEEISSTLSANKYYYSVYFKIVTSGGSVVKPQDYFSREIEMSSLKYIDY